MEEKSKEFSEAGGEIYIPPEKYKRTEQKSVFNRLFHSEHVFLRFPG